MTFVAIILGKLAKNQRNRAAVALFAFTLYILQCCEYNEQKNVRTRYL